METKTLLKKSIFGVSLFLLLFIVSSDIDALSSYNDSNNNEKREYAPHQIIVKFKVDIAATAESQLTGESKAPGTQPYFPKPQPYFPASIAELNYKYGVKKIEPLIPSGCLKGKQTQKESVLLKSAVSAPTEAIDAPTEAIDAPAEVVSAPAEAKTTGLDRIYKLELVEGQSVEQAVAEYSRDPNVEYAQPNYKYVTYRTPLPRVPYIPNDYFIEDNQNPGFWRQGSWYQNYPDLWGLQKIQAIEAWNIFDADNNGIIEGDERIPGEGIVIAVIDTGVDYNHEDIAGNIWTNEDEFEGDYNGDGFPGIGGVDDDGDGLIDEDSNGHSRYLDDGVTPNPAWNNDIPEDDDENGYADDIRGYDFSDYDNDPIDEHGHGTHCAGTIAATGDNYAGIIGVAYGAKIMPVKIFENAYTSNCVRAILYAAYNGADVLSNSWGPRYRNPSDPVLEEAIDEAYAQGCVVVFAAGNNDDDVAYYSPANYSRTMAVAATYSNDRKAGFSNWGELIDVAAPGVSILSLRAEGTDMETYIVDDLYCIASGTSMACPHVAGLAGLLLSLSDTLTNEDVRTLINDFADDVSQPDIGSGRINAHKSALRITDNGEVPTISSVQFSSIDISIAGDGIVTITWQTNKPTTSTVYYGTGSLDSSVTSSNYVTDHSVTITGLAINTTYNFAVESKDIMEQSVYDDNGGGYYQCIIIPPRIDVTPASVTFEAIEGSSPSGKTLTIDNISEPGAVDLIFEASHSSAWLSVPPTEGRVSFSSSLDLQLIANASNLAAGNYADEITIYNNTVNSNPVTIPATLTVIPHPIIRLREYNIIDDAGNGDGQFNVGEEVGLQIRVENTGSLVAPGASATLSLPTSDPYITIVDGQISLGDIPPHTFLTSSENFILRAVEDMPPYYEVTLSLDIEDTEGSSWHESLRLEVIKILPIVYVPQDFPTIQLAINSLAEGGTIYVMPGLYEENLEITKPLILRSNSGNPNDTEIKGVVDSGKATIFVHDVNGPQESVTIEGFKVSNGGGSWGSYGGGGGIFSKFMKEINIANNILVDNNYGGIVISRGVENFRITCNIIMGNSNSSGGGVYVYPRGDSEGLIANNIIAENYVTYNGGGINVYCWSSDGNAVNLTIMNNTIAYNNASNWSPYGAGLYFSGDGLVTDSIVLRNNIIRENVRRNSSGLFQNIYIDGLDLDFERITYNNIQGLAREYGTGEDFGYNIDEEPLFMDVTSSPKDFHLQPLSPCVDAGDPADDYSLEPEPNGQRVNMGAYGNTEEAARTPDQPIIEVNPRDFSLTIPERLKPFTETITISNIAEAGAYDLTFEIPAPSQNWLSVEPDNGNISPQSSMDVQMTVNSTLLGPGEHTGEIIIINNASSQGSVSIPITVTATPSIALYYDGYTIIDDWSGRSFMVNGDRRLNPGERAELQISVRNLGSIPAEDVSAELLLTEGDPYVTILDYIVDLGDIGAGANVSSTNNFLIEVAEDTPHGHQVRFDLVFTDQSGGIWREEFQMTVVKPFPEYNISDPIRIQNTPRGIIEGIRPQVSCDEQGYVYAVWERSSSEGSIYFNCSSDRGDSWGSQEIKISGGAAIGKDNVRPKMCSDQEGNIYAIWIGAAPLFDPVLNYKYDAFFSCSNDHGVNWQPAVRLDTDEPGAAHSTEAQICCDNNGHVYAVWTDGRDTGMLYQDDIYFNYSDDYGATDSWQTSDIRIDTDLPGAAASYRPQISCDDKGHVYIVWDDNRNGQKDIYFNYSDNYGAPGTWQTSDIRIDTDLAGASYSAHPQINCDNNGHVYVTWVDDRSGETDIYFNYSTDYGVTWQPNDIRLDTDMPGAAGSAYPEISSDGNGKVYVVWHDARYPRPGRTDIYFNHSDDYGATWQSEDTRLNTDIPPPEYSYDVSDFPKISSDNNGNVYVVWQDSRGPSLTDDIYMNYSPHRGTAWLESDIRLDGKIPLQSACSQNPHICSDSKGNAYIAWQDRRNGVDEIYSCVYSIYEPLTLDDIASQEVREVEQLEFTVTASNLDGTALELFCDTQALEQDLQNNLSNATFTTYFDQTTGQTIGTFTWRPDTSSAGTYYPLAFVARDAQGRCAYKLMTINVINTIPQITSINPTTVPPGGPITITGENFGYTRTVDSNIIFTDEVVATDIESWTNTEIVCRVPEDAESGPVKVVTLGGESNGVEINMGIPDLTLGDITYSPENPKVGETVTFTVPVMNIGDAPAEDFTVRFFSDPGWFEGVPGHVALNERIDHLDPGEIRIITFQHQYVEAGTYTPIFNADHFHEVEESDEENNGAELTITVVAIPAAPSNLTYFILEWDKVRLNWQDNSDNEDGFKIERKTWQWGHFIEIAQVSANTTEFEDEGLKWYKKYYYRVRAHNTAADSEPSNVVSVKAYYRPYIYSTCPYRPYPEDVIRIYGRYFLGYNPSKSKVIFYINNIQDPEHTVVVPPEDILGWNNYRIKCRLPAELIKGRHGMRVLSSIGRSPLKTIRIRGPRIYYVRPRVVKKNQRMKIYGRGFGALNDQSKIYICGYGYVSNDRIKSWIGTKVVFKVPKLPKKSCKWWKNKFKIKVHTKSGWSNKKYFYYW